MMSLMELTSILQDFPPITPDEMKSVKLMNRIDTKYLINRSQLPIILTHLKKHFFIQNNGNQNIAHYKNLYYDTENIKMYLEHHNRKLERQKLRARLYCNTGDTFCEVKNKNNKGRTHKKRIPMPISYFDAMLTHAEIRHFVMENLRYDINSLMPQVETEFDRITLVNHDKTERLTLDFDLSFFNHQTGLHAEIPHLLIIELKQDGNCHSFFQKIAIDFRIHPYRISKYCLGTMLTNPQAKSNRFKEKIRYIEKLRFIKEE